MNKQIKLSGISRNLPQNSAPDGSCQEIINARYRKGAWRPVGDKAIVHNASFTYNGSPILFKEIYLHDIEQGIIDGQPNYIGLYDGIFAGIYLINPVTNICTKISDIPKADYTKVVFLKRTMIVTTSTGLMVFLYTTTNGGQYGLIGNLPTPYVDLYSTEYVNPVPATPIAQFVESEPSHTPEAVLGNLYAICNQQSANYGRLYGSIAYIVAYRLFDGSYVMHSVPRYHEISNGGILRCNNPDGSGWDNALWRWQITFKSISGILVSQIYDPAHFDSMKDLVDSIVVFATKATPLLKIDSTTVTEKVLQKDGSGGYDWWNQNIADFAPLNSPDFEDLCKSDGWYQIMEFDFAEVVGNPVGSIVKMADTKGFYQDYATRKALPADNFSHHALVAKNAMVYNDRVHVQSIKTLYGIPEIHLQEFTGYAPAYDRQGVIVVYLSTGLGKAVLVNQRTFATYTRLETGEKVIAWNGIVGYHDSRATKMELAVQDIEGTLRLVFSVDLKKNEAMNFAYYVRPDFNKIPPTAEYNYGTRFIRIDNLGAVYNIPQASGTPFDTNRIQVSEIQNPLVYLAKNSYQVGTGEGIAMATASEPLSQGNFGQFPVMVFTTKGRFVLAQGQGDILYASIQPVDGEVADNPMNVLGVGSGIVYSTERGLYLANGMEKVWISETVEGKPETSLLNTEEMQTLVTDLRCTPSLHDALSEVDFLTYLKTSRVGYDHVNKEIIVTNAQYAYSYVYSTEYKIWYKISQSYSLLVNAYPELYGVNGSKIYNISDDDHQGNTAVLMVSNAMNLDLPEVRKKIERMIARCYCDTASGSYVGLYVFSTDDLETYQFATGRQRTGQGLKDLLLQRSQGSARYFAIVFNGVVSHESELSYVDTMFIDRMSQKIR